MLGYHVSQIELMQHMHKMNDFFGYVLEGNRNYGKMVVLNMLKFYWQHLGAVSRERLSSDDLSEFLINKINNYESNRGKVQ